MDGSSGSSALRQLKPALPLAPLAAGRVPAFLTPSGALAGSLVRQARRFHFTDCSF